MSEQKILAQLKAYGIQNNIPNISETNARFLRDITKISRAKNILEIGMANGYSTMNFAFELQKENIDGKIISIDFSQKSYTSARENFEKAKLEKYIEPILGNAIDEIPKLQDDFFDFVFIDAMKKRSLDFVKLSFPKLKKNGILIVDDVIKFKDKMVGLYEYLQKENINYNIIPIDIDDGIMMLVK